MPLADPRAILNLISKPSGSLDLAAETRINYKAFRMACNRNPQEPKTLKTRVLCLPER